MDDYLSKPIELEQLNSLIQEYFPYKIVGNKEETIEKDIEEKELEEEKKDNVVETDESIDEEISNDTLEALESVKQIDEEIQEEDSDTQISDNVVEIQESAVEVEEVVETIEEKRKSDILVYHSMSLIANLYGSILKNLEYDIDIVTNDQEFLDRLDDTEYTFVIYEGEPFKNIKCMIVELIRDTGAKPFVLIHNLLEHDEVCCDTLEEKANIEDLRKKLKID